MRRPFPFGIASLIVGGMMLVGAPFAVRTAWRFDDRLAPLVGVYLLGFLVSVGLALAAFLRPRPPHAPSSGWAPPPAGPPGTQPPAAPPTALAPPAGDRTAATAGVALAGIGCSAIAAILFVGFLILCVAAYVLFEILRALFAPHGVS